MEPDSHWLLEPGFFDAIMGIAFALLMVFAIAGVIALLVFTARYLRRANSDFRSAQAQVEDSLRRQEEAIELTKRSLEVNEELLAVQREIRELLQELLRNQKFRK